MNKMTHQNLPLIGLLTVQLLTGMMLMPLTNFGSIYLNEELAYPLQQVATIIALGQVVGMIAAIIAGSLSDRYGHKWVLFLGVSGVAMSSLLYIMQAPWIVIFLWCMTNAGGGLSVVGGQGYLTLASKAGILGLVSALYNWGYTLGGAIGVPLATVILGEDRFALLGVSLIGLGVVAVLISTLLPNIHSEDPVQSIKTKVGYQVLLRRDLILLIMLRFLPTCFYGILTLLPLVIKQQSGSNVIVASYITGSSLFATLAQLVAGRVADKYGLILPTQIAFATILIAILGMILTGQTLWGLYLFGSLGVGAAWALSTLLPGMVTRTAEPEIRGRVFGSLHLVWTLAMALGTLLGGNLLTINLRIPFMIVGILNIVALGLTVPFFRMTANTPVSKGKSAN